MMCHHNGTCVNTIWHATTILYYYNFTSHHSIICYDNVTLCHIITKCHIMSCHNITWYVITMWHLPRTGVRSEHTAIKDDEAKQLNKLHDRLTTTTPHQPQLQCWSWHYPPQGSNKSYCTIVAFCLELYCIFC